MDSEHKEGGGGRKLLNRSKHIKKGDDSETQSSEAGEEGKENDEDLLSLNLAENENKDYRKSVFGVWILIKHMCGLTGS